MHNGKNFIDFEPEKNKPKKRRIKEAVSPPSLRPRVKCFGWDGEWGRVDLD